MLKTNKTDKLYDQYTHNCPGCARLIRWALEFCVDCSWRGKPRPNHAWDDQCQN